MVFYGWAVFVCYDCIGCLVLMAFMRFFLPEIASGRLGLAFAKHGNVLLVENSWRMKWYFDEVTSPVFISDHRH